MQADGVSPCPLGWTGLRPWTKAAFSEDAAGVRDAQHGRPECDLGPESGARKTGARQEEMAHGRGGQLVTAHFQHGHSAQITSDQAARETAWRWWHPCWVSGSWGDSSRGTGVREQGRRGFWACARCRARGAQV